MFLLVHLLKVEFVRFQTQVQAHRLKNKKTNNKDQKAGLTFCF